MEQWLARWAHNPKVGGSSPPPATYQFSQHSQRGIEQWLARRAHNPEAAGSNPVPATRTNRVTSEVSIEAASDVSFLLKIVVV